MKEIWKDIKNYEGLYQISNFGNVKSLARSIDCGKFIRNVKEKLLKQSKNSSGYLHVTFSKNNKLKTFTVHKLIMNTFIGDSNLTINHKDCNKENNNINNLEYITNEDNLKHAHKNKLINYRKGINHHCTRISLTNLNKIYKMAMEGIPHKIIAEKFNIAISTVSTIKTKKSYRKGEIIK